MAKIVAAIRSRFGTLGILGNHDYFEEAPRLEAMGVRMLMNAAVEITESGDNVWIAGVDDAWDYDCADLPRALSRMPPDASRFCSRTARILSTKQPHQAFSYIFAAIRTPGKSGCR